jgi:hypothetical protein
MKMRRALLLVLMTATASLFPALGSAEHGDVDRRSGRTANS